MTHSSRWTRRDMLKTATTGGSIVALNGIIPWSLRAMDRTHTTRVHSRPQPLAAAIYIHEPLVRDLAMRALDAAKAAGANYADVRLTRNLRQTINSARSYKVTDGERIGVGVRAVVDGYLGFASSPYWNAEEVVLLARDAVTQAKTNARGSTPLPVWAPIPVASGSWATPIQYDPFVVSVEEKLDVLNDWKPVDLRGYNGEARVSFLREERAIATTEGAYFTQTLYSSQGDCDITVDSMRREQQFGEASARGLQRSAVGWELMLEANVPGQVPRLYEEAIASLRGLPVKVGDVGRYDVVFDAATMASLVDATIGAAAQVDRALGYEANASGTSYLGPDPLALLGTYQTASPLVTITANRSMPRGLATVKWDDEGVEPERFTLVKDGTLVDYQTNREQAQWLAPYYQKQGRPVRSHGCAGGGLALGGPSGTSALDLPMQHTPNLVLEPGAQAVGFADLVADTQRGIAVLGASVAVDFQLRTGTMNAQFREIVNGKLGAVLANLEILFSTTQLWKNVQALGGRGSVERIQGGAVTSSKGEPRQFTSHSVEAVPAKVINVDFVDPRRRS